MCLGISTGPERSTRSACPAAYLIVFLLEVACFFASGSDAARTAARDAVSEPRRTSAPTKGLDR
jgi:hypothetical protein